MNPFAQELIRQNGNFVGKIMPQAFNPGTVSLMENGVPKMVSGQAVSPTPGLLMNGQPAGNLMQLLTKNPQLIQQMLMMGK